MSDQKAVYSIEIQAAGEFLSNDNLMLCLSGNKNGSPCDSPLTRLVEPSQENENSRKYELETVHLDEILSCTVLNDGRDVLNLKCITGRISFVYDPYNMGFQIRHLKIQFYTILNIRTISLYRTFIH